MLELVHNDHPSLRDHAAKVACFDATLEETLAQMAQTMYASGGIGLAAPQVGIAYQIFLVDLMGAASKTHSPDVFINPRIVAGRGLVISREGCLSLPGMHYKVPRYRHVEIAASDATGKPFKRRATGLLAWCLQHEMDHLAGLLICDRAALGLSLPKAGIHAHDGVK